MSRTRKITVRVDGSLKIGMGHVVRCKHLTTYIRWHVIPSPYITFIGEDGSPDLNESILLYLTTHPMDLLIIDCNWHGNPELTSLFPDNLPIISLHEHNFPTLTGVAAAINPSLVEQMPPAGYELGRTHFQGPDYLIIDDQIPILAKNRCMEMKQPVEVVVSLGGSDPDSTTLRVVDSLASMNNIHLQVIIGPAFPVETITKLSTNPAIKLHYKLSKIAPILAQADIAITNAATTMFESIALGVPTIAVPNNPYEALQAVICARAGAAMAVNPENIEDEAVALIKRLVADQALRQGLSSKGRSMIDGLGLSRVGDIIIKHLRG